MSYEKFYPNGWQSGNVGGTPITPEALNHIENGIKQTYSDFAPAGFGLNKSNGNVISAQNSGHAPLHSLKLYGKTTQNGTPTPENPVELESVGDDGSLSVKIGVSESDKNPQNMTIQTPNGLPGIPVSSGGNYTDENGQQWICNEIDFARGKYVQRVVRKRMQNLSLYSDNHKGLAIGFDNELKFTVISTTGMCNTLPLYTTNEQFMSANSCYAVGGYGALIQIEGCTTLEALNAYLAEHEVIVQVAWKEPIETDLTAEEIAQYSALHTNYPNTTVYNDEGAYMDVEYYSPISAVPMNMGSGRAGHIMTIDEQGCVNTAPKSSMPFAPAVESAEYPGCYYRTVNGVVEWYNPPMVPGVEYRTTERWNGKAVWTTVVNCNKLANAAQTQTQIGFSATKIIRYAGTTDEGYALPYLSGGMYVDIAVTKNTIYLTTSADFSSATAYVQLWYTKD